MIICSCTEVLKSSMKSMGTGKRVTRATTADNDYRVSPSYTILIGDLVHRKGRENGVKEQILLTPTTGKRAASLTGTGARGGRLR